MQRYEFFNGGGKKDDFFCRVFYCKEEMCPFTFFVVYARVPCRSGLLLAYTAYIKKRGNFAFARSTL